MFYYDKSFVFWRHVAKDMQKEIPLKREPNIYEYEKVLQFLDDDYKILYNQKENCVTQKEIHFTYPDIKDCVDDEIYINVLTTIFYEIGKLCVEQLNRDGIKSSELEIGMFVRAMLMPEDSFEKEVINNLIDGEIDVKEVAKKFHIDYLEVMARANDLDMF